jgi:hypothetical protein
MGNHGDGQLAPPLTPDHPMSLLPSPPEGPNTVRFKMGSTGSGKGFYETRTYTVESWGWNGSAMELNITTHLFVVFVADKDNPAPHNEA